MRSLSNPPPHRYSGAGSDRAARRRLDAEWLRARRADPASRVILMSGLEVLVRASDPPGVEILTVERLGQPLPEEAVFLGEDDGFALFAADLGPAAPSGRFVEVRTVGTLVPAREAGWCAYAEGSPFGTAGIATAGPAGALRSALTAATPGAARSATPSTSRAAIRRSSSW